MKGTIKLAVALDMLGFVVLLGASLIWWHASEMLDVDVRTMALGLLARLTPLPL
jgi:hypothetical protein